MVATDAVPVEPDGGHRGSVGPVGGTDAWRSVGRLVGPTPLSAALLVAFVLLVYVGQSGRTNVRDHGDW